MALAKTDKKAPTAEAQQVMNGGATPPFETEDAIETAAPAQAEAAAQTASTAIAAAGASAVTTFKKMETILSNLKNALPKIDWGVLPRLVGSSGRLRDGDKQGYGEWVEITLLHYQDQWVATPGDDSAEAKEYVRYSDDGVTLNDDGRTIDQYLEYLRTLGYTKAAKKEYTSLVGILEDAEKFEKDAKDNLGAMIEISLSPMSRKSWQAYQLQRSVQVARGVKPEEGSDRIKIVARAESKGDRDFTLLKVVGTN